MSSELPLEAVIASAVTSVTLMVFRSVITWYASRMLIACAAASVALAAHFIMIAHVVRPSPWLQG